MKKIFLTVAVLTMAMAGVSSARAGVRISIGLPVPVFYAAPRPVFVQPAPVVVAPAPVVVAPAQVVAAPVVSVPAPVMVARPVVVAPAPVYCAPVVRFGFYGPRGHFHRFYRHGCW